MNFKGADCRRLTFFISVWNMCADTCIKGAQVERKMTVPFWPRWVGALCTVPGSPPFWLSSPDSPLSHCTASPCQNEQWSFKFLASDIRNTGITTRLQKAGYTFIPSWYGGAPEERQPSQKTIPLPLPVQWSPWGETTLTRDYTFTPSQYSGAPDERPPSQKTIPLPPPSTVEPLTRDHHHKWLYLYPLPIQWSPW